MGHAYSSFLMVFKAQLFIGVKQVPVHPQILSVNIQIHIKHGQRFRNTFVSLSVCVCVVGLQPDAFYLMST